MRTPDLELQERRRADIVAAATRCFLARGFHQTSMQDIAKAARISMGLVYRYFRSKEDIIAAAAEVDREPLLERVRALATSTDLLSELRALAHAAVTSARTEGYAALAAEVVSEGFRNPKVADIVVRDEGAMRAALLEALETQRHAGRVRGDVDLNAFAEVFLAAIDGLSARGMAGGPRIALKRCLAALEPLLAGVLTPK